MILHCISIEALAFAQEGAKVVLIYKKLPRAYDPNNIDKHGVDRYFKANAENAEAVVASVTNKTVEITIPQAMDNECIHSYRFEFYKEDKLEKSATIWSEFYFVNMPNEITQEFNELEPNTNYRVNITAIDSWGKESDKPLTVEFRTEGE